MFRLIWIIMALFFSLDVYAWDCMPGKYSGKTWAQIVGHHNMDATLEVTKDKEKCVFHFKCAEANADEIWESEENKLLQKELDEKGKEKFTYGATLEVRKGVEGYYLNCDVDGNPGCEANGDNRTFWKIETPKGKIIYSMWGVDPSKASDPKEVAKKRIEYTFQVK